MVQLGQHSHERNNGTMSTATQQLSFKVGLGLDTAGSSFTSVEKAIKIFLSNHCKPKQVNSILCGLDFCMRID